MSLVELTRNSFQGGISPAKWINLVKLFLSKNQYVRDVERELSDSVLLLFGSYPGDPTLQAYLRIAVQEGVLSVATLVSTFLQAARSLTLQSPATLDLLCKVALETHYMSRMPPIGSLVQFAELPLNVLGTIHDAILLLKIAYTLPPSDFHQLTLTASNLVHLLLSCASDVSQLSTTQAMTYFTDTTDLLQIERIPLELRQSLESFALSLISVLGDDAKVARETQMMHPIHIPLGNKNDASGPTSENDTVTFSLFFNNLILRRANNYGCGDGARPVATLVALLRWMSWSPIMFYSQMLLSCSMCLAHITSAGDIKRASLWRAFIIGRLPRLLTKLEAALDSERIAQFDPRQVIKIALSALSSRMEILAQCDTLPESPNAPDVINEDVDSPRPLLRELLGQCMSVGLIDHAFTASLDPSAASQSSSKAFVEAQETGMSFEAYLDLRISPETGFEDALSFLDRVRTDYGAHADLAQTIHKRFTSLVVLQDVESLSHLSKILYTQDGILDIISLHVRLSDFVASGLAFLEDYDCETVGDPQTALSHLGDVVLFLQWVVSTYHLSKEYFLWEPRVLHPNMLESRQHGELSVEEITAFGAWFKALFDSNSEGIEDAIIRSTKPRILCRVSAVLFSQAIFFCSVQKIDMDVLNNGVSYFLGPLLNWTLVGVVKVLLREIQQKGFMAPIHLAVLQTLLLSSLCPQPVISLCAQGILRIFGGSKARGLGQAGTFDPTAILAIATRALGVRDLGLEKPPLNPQQSMPPNQPQQALREALRGNKVPYLDIDRCLLLTTPTKFLQLMWAELNIAASLGNMDVCKRVATHVFIISASTGALPLLPPFIHTVLPSLIMGMDRQQTPDQTIQIELLVSILSSSLAAAFHAERAWRSICGEQRYLLGQSSLAMARGLAEKLKKKGSPTCRVVSQRLASSQVFMSNFPMVLGEL